MAYTPKPGQGSLFPNRNKKTDNHPSWRGDFIGMDGIRYGIAMWEKQGAKGPYMSIAVEPYRAPEPKDMAKVKALEAANAFMDDIPF